MRNKAIALIFSLTIVVGGIFTVFNIRASWSNISDNSIFDMPKAIDFAANESIPKRYSIINANGLFQKVIGRLEIDDQEANVYKMKNNQLIYGANRIDDSEISSYATSLKEFNNALKKNKTKLYYVQLPYKIENGSNQMPVGTTEWANNNANRLIKNLLLNDISYLDLRTRSSDAIEFVSTFDKDFNEYSDLFYNTDQHWTNETALWGARQILTKLGVSTDSLESDKFKMKRYNNKFLGSFGKKTGSSYGGMDNYDLILPRYETSFEYTIKSREGDDIKSGSFEETLLDKSNLAGDPYEVNTYETYTGGNYAYTVTKNKKLSSKKYPKVLLIRDSFSCAMMPFLSLGCSEVTTIDLRYLRSQTALEIAKDGDFDAVVVAYNPSMFGLNTFKFM